MKRLKTALVAMKRQIKEVALNEGVVLNTLYSCMRLHQGKHHLYDEEIMKVAGESPSRRGGAAAAEEEDNFEEFD